MTPNPNINLGPIQSDLTTSAQPYPNPVARLTWTLPNQPQCT